MPERIPAQSSHGIVNYKKAILESCDIFFYNVGMKLGIDRLAYYATKMGLGHRTRDGDDLLPKTRPYALAGMGRARFSSQVVRRRKPFRYQPAREP